MARPKVRRSGTIKRKHTHFKKRRDTRRYKGGGGGGEEVDRDTGDNDQGQAPETGTDNVSSQKSESFAHF